MEKSWLTDFVAFNGRLSRMSFFTKGIVVLFIYFLGLISWHIFMPLGIIFLLAAAIGTLSICARRCHDLGFSGFFSLLSFIPYLDVIFILLLLFVPGGKRGNKYGPANR